MFFFDFFVFFVFLVSNVWFLGFSGFEYVSYFSGIGRWKSKGLAPPRTLGVLVFPLAGLPQAPVRPPGGGGVLLPLLLLLLILLLALVLVLLLFQVRENNLKSPMPGDCGSSLEAEAVDADNVAPAPAPAHALDVLSAGSEGGPGGAPALDGLSSAGEGAVAGPCDAPAQQHLPRGGHRRGVRADDAGCAMTPAATHPPHP